MIALYFLLIFMIIAAILAIELEDLISSVVALIAVGLALCIAFIVLKAPDVAIMQLVVETLALLVLIKATLRKDLPFSASGRWYVNTFIYAAFFVTLVVVALKCFKDLPPFGNHLMKAAVLLGQNLPKTGDINLVTVVTLKYRIFDSFAEAAILFVAVIAVLVILRPKGKKHD
jgi:multisubunit Na+/H+ antiporter MnhB subunit